MLGPATFRASTDDSATASTCNGCDAAGTLTPTGCAPGAPDAATCVRVFNNGILVKRQRDLQFTIGAVGYIGGGNNDHWLIDSNKELVNTQNGVN